MDARSADGSGSGERFEAWWLNLPGPVLSLVSTVLIAAANPRYTRRLSFAAAYVFPGALLSFIFGLIALVRPHPEHAIGLWIWSAILFLVGSAIVAGAVRATTRSVE